MAHENDNWWPTRILSMAKSNGLLPDAEPDRPAPETVRDMLFLMTQTQNWPVSETLRDTLLILMAERTGTAAAAKAASRADDDADAR